MCEILTSSFIADGLLDTTSLSYLCGVINGGFGKQLGWLAFSQVLFRPELRSLKASKTAKGNIN